MEYCEFGSSLTRCKEWLKDENEGLYNRFYSEGALFICDLCSPRGLRGQSEKRSGELEAETPCVWTIEALQAKIGTLSLEAQEKLEKDTAKKEAKAEAKADAALKKKMVRALFIRLVSFPPPQSLSLRFMLQASQVRYLCLFWLPRAHTEWCIGHNQADRAQ